MTNSKFIHESVSKEPQSEVLFCIFTNETCLLLISVIVNHLQQVLMIRSNEIFFLED